MKSEEEGIYPEERKEAEREVWVSQNLIG